MTIINLKHVNLSFPIYGADMQSLKKKIIHVTTGGLIKCGQNKVLMVQALRDITFKIQEGDRIGLIGSNGAGKSTLLRVLAGIYQPTSGYINVKGKVSALLNVMLGLNPELNGFENITLRCILQGMSFEEIQQRKSEIAEFTELDDYLMMPIRTYSAGMRVRLAFAIATAIEPEILILDEVISAGDAHFMNKAQQRIHRLINTSKSLILASHDSFTIKAICNKIIVLKSGEMVFFGDTDEGIAFYNASSQ